MMQQKVKLISNIRPMEVKVRVKKADLEKCETQLDVIELVSGEWLKQHPPGEWLKQHLPLKRK